jgi:hypothetical protein
MGCYFQNGATVDDYAYDNLLAKLLRAGADINMTTPGGDHPITRAVANLNLPILERLLRDGAAVDFPIRVLCMKPEEKPNLYLYLTPFIKTNDPERLLSVIGELSRAGLSPFAKTSFGGAVACKNTSFYDLVVDAGNLELAKAIKNAVKADNTSPPPNRPPLQTVPNSGNGGLPGGKVGNWQIGSTPDGRPYAIAETVEGDGGRIKALRLECVAGGQLEYLPVTTHGAPVHAILLDVDMENTANAVELKAVNGRIAGPSAVRLSKEFLTAEAEARKQDPTEDWAISLILNDPMYAGDMINGRGFSEMRQSLLQHCK